MKVPTVRETFVLLKFYILTKTFVTMKCLQNITKTNFKTSIAKNNMAFLKVLGMGTRITSFIYYLSIFLSWLYVSITLLMYIFKPYNFGDKILSIVGFLYVNICFIKLSLLFIQKDKLNFLLYSIESIWRKSGNENFLPTLMNAEKKGNIYLYSYCIMAYSTCILAVVIPVLKFGMNKLIFGYREAKITMMFNVDFGKDNPSNFFPFLLSMSIMYLAPLVIAIDCIYITLTLHVVALFKLLQQRLGNVNECTSQNLSQCIEIHQIALKSAEILDELFRLPMLVQFSVASVKICGLIITLSRVSPYNTNGGLNTQYFFVIFILLSDMFVIYLYCFCGQSLLNESEKVTDVLYDISWYTTVNKNFRQIFQLFLYQSQRPVTLTIANLRPINMETFLAILQGAYSYFMFMQNVTE